eukprot:scaffold221699_cov33-Tisochrysis_lutea.AAC.3
MESTRLGNDCAPRNNGALRKRTSTAIQPPMWSRSGASSSSAVCSAEYMTLANSFNADASRTRIIPPIESEILPPYPKSRAGVVSSPTTVTRAPRWNVTLAVASSDTTRRGIHGTRVLALQESHALSAVGPCTWHSSISSSERSMTSWA